MRAGAVGIYVPGGTAVLPSSTLMMAVPAGIAGCATVVMATPPRADGQVSASAEDATLLHHALSLPHCYVSASEMTTTYIYKRNHALVKRQCRGSGSSKTGL